MSDERERHDSHSENPRELLSVRTLEEYREVHKRSLDDPEGFWGEQAECLSWDRNWTFVQSYDLDEGRIDWFGGGLLNASYNCLDRRLESQGDKIAYYWEGDEPTESKSVTYRELYTEVNKFAAFLKSRGVAKGDRVAIYMPMIVELPVAMLACARIGAVHCVLFGGFSSDALSARIKDCGATTVITADGSYRGGRTVTYKANIDEAIKNNTVVGLTVVYRRVGMDLELDPEREIWWDEALADESLPDYTPPEPMDSEAPLFILYASASAGKPKGIVHSHAGYLLYSALTTRMLFDMHDDEVFWCTADIGWLVGHSYVVYGPLVNGYTGVMIEGLPTYPGYDRIWQVIERYRVNKLHTAPTVIRTVAHGDAASCERYDLSSLNVLGSFGEPIPSETWEWYREKVGKGNCPVIDAWSQTEAGAHLISPLPQFAPTKPGAGALPFFGVDPIILDPDTGEEAEFADHEGLLCITGPWPSIARTVYGDHDLYIELYFNRVPGMYFTGDGASKDEEGCFKITGRVDDVLNVAGRRLGTAELEWVLLQHPMVAEAAVVGAPHPVKGQSIYAFITPEMHAIKSADLKRELVELVRSRIGPIATIDTVQWADELPKTRGGKILRRILQNVAAVKFDELEDTSTLDDPTVLDKLIKDRMELIEK